MKLSANQILREGTDMFEVSEKATEMIKETLKDQEKIPAIRVIMNEGG
jgi:hypothetical protein